MRETKSGGGDTRQTLTIRPGGPLSRLVPIRTTPIPIDKVLRSFHHYPPLFLTSCWSLPAEYFIIGREKRLCPFCGANQRPRKLHLWIEPLHCAELAAASYRSCVLEPHTPQYFNCNRIAFLIDIMFLHRRDKVLRDYVNDRSWRYRKNHTQIPLS